ncbi:MAG: SGNH/GDSL hydrolase family protein [Streptosporangiaceae bacterium]|jgi:lysophospholipase L1-like esterase
MTELWATARHPDVGHLANTALLAPLALVQARRAVRRAPRLPAASGPAHGTAGHGDPRRRLLVIGESTAAGVGAGAHGRALPGFLAAAMSRRVGGTVTWAVRGKSGATARKVLAELVPSGQQPFDVTVLTVGINDLFDRRAPRLWAADLRGLIDALSGEGGRTRVIVSGMPPVQRVPAIPQPLRFVLSRRARAMDRVTRQVSAERGAVYVPISAAIVRGEGLFASDGFHPSEAGYRVWAGVLAGAMPG